jgi:hypothetical protein
VGTSCLQPEMWQSSLIIQNRQLLIRNISGPENPAIISALAPYDAAPLWLAL